MQKEKTATTFLDVESTIRLLVFLPVDQILLICFFVYILYFWFSSWEVFLFFIFPPFFLVILYIESEAISAISRVMGNEIM